MRLTSKALSRVTDAYRETRTWVGSIRLRTGAAFNRAGIKGVKWIGEIGVDQAFQAPEGQILSVDAVTGAVSMHVGIPPKVVRS